jgi:cytochrome c oxidase assembly protein subunit 11
MDGRAGARRTAIKLGFVAVGMFAFGYLLAPLYDVLCEVTGLNGKTAAVAAPPSTEPVDTARTVTVEFTGQAAGGLAWEFRPLVKELRVHPGETVEMKYLARNQAGTVVTGQAVPSVAPGRAASHFQKIECFCFSEQKLAPGEAREMPVRFTVSPKLPDNVHTITLSYAFFDISKPLAARAGAPAHSVPSAQRAGG